MTLTIALDSLGKGDIDKLIQSLKVTDFADQLFNRRLDYDLYEQLNRVVALAFHEFTHFIDVTCTPWGIQFLMSLNSAYLTNYERFSCGENDFYKAKQFCDLANSLRMPRYYTAKTPGVNTGRPWSYTTSIGRKFSYDGALSDRPIPFMSFHNLDLQRIVRSPISLISLLEASAMAQEFLYRNFLVEALAESSRFVEKRTFQDKILKYVYNPDITEYSVCAHLVANMQGYTDVLDALYVAERIVRVVLNITPDMFAELEFSKEAQQKLNFDTTPSVYDAAKTAINYQDRGFLYYWLSVLLPDCSPDSNEKIDGAIETSLGLLGLDLNKVEDTARLYVATESDYLIKSPLHSLGEVAACALSNFDARMQSKNPSYDFTDFELPSFLLGDNTIQRLSGKKSSKLQYFDLEKAYDELIEGQLWVEKFYEACT